jgi:hypothetical protein
MEKSGERDLNRRDRLRRYFSDEFTEVKPVLRELPMPLTAVMITMLRPTAIRQYSIAVAPDSSFRNREINCSIQKLPLADPERLHHPLMASKSKFDWLQVH